MRTNMQKADDPETQRLVERIYPPRKRHWLDWHTPWPDCEDAPPCTWKDNLLQAAIAIFLCFCVRGSVHLHIPFLNG